MTTKSSSEDAKLQEIIAHMRASGTICGTGDEMEKCRAEMAEIKRKRLIQRQRESSKRMRKIWEEIRNGSNLGG